MRLRVKLGMLVELLWGAQECSPSDWTLLNSVTGESLYAVKAIDCFKTKITDEPGSGCINFTQTKTYRSPWQLMTCPVPEGTQLTVDSKVCPRSKCVWPQLEWQQTQAVCSKFHFGGQELSLQNRWPPTAMNRSKVCFGFLTIIQSGKSFAGLWSECIWMLHHCNVRARIP